MSVAHAWCARYMFSHSIWVPVPLGTCQMNRRCNSPDCSQKHTTVVQLWVTAGVCGLQAQNGSLFPSAVVSLYCSYLCYSALQSEPHSYQCNGLGKHFTAASGSTLAVGMVIAIVSVVYSALRAGSNNRTFMAAREEAIEEGLLERETEGTSAGLDGEPEGQSMGRFHMGTSPTSPSIERSVWCT